MQNYASLQETHEEESGFLLHISEPTHSRWNHIENLDSFFTRVYKYHQRHGFMCMLVRELFTIHQYSFVICLSLYLVYGIDYDKLFNHEQKITLDEVMLPVTECIKNFSTVTWILLIFAIFLLCFKLIKKSYDMILFWDIKQFFNSALNIQDKDLDNLTWYNVQAKVKQAQLDLQMCIHKRELTELDIYHRILRQENYLVAMVNKRLLPPRYYLPFLGEMVYLTKGLKYNIIGLLFWSPWSPFENPWHLREEFKRHGLRHELASKLRRQILWLAFFNMLFSPVILLWQTLFYFFTYFELVRREPGSFGVRFWSMYARLYLRHFNELEHELHARLQRAYRPAAKYLAAFSSPMANLIAEHIAFLSSAILGVFLIISFYDNEVIYIEHVLSIMAFLTGVIAISRSIVPDETTVWCPETLLRAVVLHTHYLPGDWQGKAHTDKIKSSFQQLFQYRFAALIEELVSPLVTPYLLLRYLYPRSLDIVDFFRNFTVSVVGVGDVCSFAQMDIRKHGDPDWQVDSLSNVVAGATDQYSQAEDGKVELSLMHFATTNPEWQPPEDAQGFVDSVLNDENNDVLRMNSLALENIIDSSSMLDFDPQSGMDVNRPRSLFKAEGPDLYNSARNMRTSTLLLHNRRSRVVKSAEESTPLLFSQK